jgi:endoplasmic reticulum-Golgi intermediate compartment protein 3
VTVTESRRSLYSFLTSLCAIVGGVFTVVGLLDSCLHSAAGRIRAAAKAGLGKQQ